MGAIGPSTGSPFTDKDFYARAFTSGAASQTSRFLCVPCVHMAVSPTYFNSLLGMTPAQAVVAAAQTPHSIEVIAATAGDLPTG